MRFQVRPFGRRLIGAAAIALSTMMASAAAHAEGIIDVTIDFAKVMKLERPAATIVVGNPGIADATVEDETTVVLTGRTAGTTNLIVLDDKGQEIVNSAVRVSSNVQHLTTVFYGGDRHTFSCAPTCEQVISVGDEPTSFQNATQQIQTRQQFANGQ
jgi:Flp pilus assembly secretin CpaC